MHSTDSPRTYQIRCGTFRTAILSADFASVVRHARAISRDHARFAVIDTGDAHAAKAIVWCDYPDITWFGGQTMQ